MDINAIRQWFPRWKSLFRAANVFTICGKLILLTFTFAVRSVFGEPETGSAATSNQAAIPVAQLGAAPVPVLTEVPH